ncbi:hypothetical protein LCGC14_0651750 [marine sediment metagenome]|uniref:BLUF domain-containing protein n=2 Tax=root TaxID=1 RepID=A0A831QPR8_9FLAO|nr:BLUF domain-containing protein [Pricia antarctica]
MYCIIYRSTTHSVLTQLQIQNLLNQAKDFNRKNQITGCLLYYHHEFVQYLEGEEKVVTALFDKIKKDIRHYNVDLLVSGFIYGREFKNWSMAYENFIGPNSRLEYLKMLVETYIDDENTFTTINPATKKFWTVVRTLLSTQKVEDFQ